MFQIPTYVYVKISNYLSMLVENRKYFTFYLKHAYSLEYLEYSYISYVFYS